MKCLGEGEILLQAQELKISIYKANKISNLFWMASRSHEIFLK
jgi:hypothetical protein